MGVRPSTNHYGDGVRVVAVLTPAPCRRPQAPATPHTLEMEEFMAENTCSNDWSNHSTKLWLGIAAGTAIGLGIAISRRQKKTRWDAARRIGERLSDHSGDLSAAAANIVGRVKVILEEGRKVAEDAGELWAQGRKVAGF